ncbi:hypothetical protein HXS80_15910 [Streptomyces sp. CB04723]|uniref:hypothetical protein n=1 Tax=Streptomyces TaxID=1883 RepID=UPI0015C486D9|nr:hypothetical protein [Streptomyces sp. CB04723]QLG33014.1 hypothetical protein HXS80_15910 [Streptomyces sp. CB04723]
MSGQNVVSVRGGKVHHRQPYLGDHVFPACRTGAMTNSGTKYRTTEAPVDCKTCSAYDAQAFANYYPSIEDDPNVTKEADMPAAAKKTTAKKPPAKKTATPSPAAAANAPDVDALISDIHAVIDQLKAVTPGLGAHDEAATLKQEADEKIRQLPTAKRNTLRKAVVEAFEAATKTPESAPDAAPAPAAEPITPTSVQTRAEAAADDPRQYEGVDALIKDGVEAFTEGLDLGLKLSNVGDRLAGIILRMRLSIPNPDSDNLPDLMSIRKTTKNAAGEIYDAVRKTIADDDVNRLSAHNSLVRATQNKASDVLVEWLSGFDTTQFAKVSPLLQKYFPGTDEILKENAEAIEAAASEGKEAPAELSVSDAIRELYARRGIILPRYGRTELARIDRRVKKLEAARKELDALESAPDADENKVHELQDTIVDLKQEIPEVFLEKTQEKTDAERTADALADVRAAMTKVAKRAKKVTTAKQKQKVKTEAYAMIRDFADELGLDLSALVPADDDQN